MSEETIQPVEPLLQPLPQSQNIGLDIGTMNLVVAKLNNNSIESCALRNVFLEVDSINIGSMDLTNISHVKIDDKLFILSEDAYNFANIFNKPVSRPMSKGLISSNEIDNIDVLGSMIKILVDNNSKSTARSTCCYSVPANPIDSDLNITYHKNVFERVLNQLGYNPIALNEATAIIYSQCEDCEFTGIGISFGAGMTNVAIVFKAVPVLTFSLSRGGDWIDQNAGVATGTVSNRITVIKERNDFNLQNFKIGNKKEQRIREAISYYYNDLINYTTQNISKQLVTLEVNFPSEIPIILSGGTSKVSGFVNFVEEIFSNYEFPFEISEIKSASDPLTAVAEGCLIKSFRN
jgi:actin-like ATPase involved in cell morphogenesis